MSDQQTCSDGHIVWEGLLNHYDRWIDLKPIYLKAWESQKQKKHILLFSEEHDYSGVQEYGTKSNLLSASLSFHCISGPRHILQLEEKNLRPLEQSQTHQLLREKNTLANADLLFGSDLLTLNALKPVFS